jgi:O-antigen/teichoic acid export membrane protein
VTSDQSQSPEAGQESPLLRVSGIGRGIAWRYSCQAVSAAGGLFLVGFAFRKLGASTYGAYALVITVLGLLGTVDFGLSMSVVRATARDNPSFSVQASAQARRDVEVAHSAYGVIGAIALLISVASIPVLVAVKSRNVGGTYALPITVGLLGLSVGLSLATSAYTGLPTGRQQFHVPAIAGILGVIANVAVVVPTLGMLGLPSLGLGQLANALVSATFPAVWLKMREPWFHLLPGRARWTEVRRVGSFAIPLLVISVYGQVIAATDLVVVGAVATAAAVAFYKIGNLAPSRAVSWIFNGYDTVFPSLAGTQDERGQEAATLFLTRVAGYVAGSSFCAMALLRADVVTVIVGHQSSLAEEVLMVFCGVWLVNIPVHGLMLLLIARGKQGVFIPLVAAEAIANLALTVLFAVVIGPIGPALATLVTIIVTNVIVLPILVRKEFGSMSSWRIAGNGFACGGIGGAVAATAMLPILVLGVGWARLASGLGVAGAASILIGFLLLGGSGRETLVAMFKRHDPTP